MGTRQNHLTEAVLTSTHNLCFEQKYEKYQSFLSENIHFLEVKFSIYLHRHGFVMKFLVYPYHFQKKKQNILTILWATLADDISNFFLFFFFFSRK